VCSAKSCGSSNLCHARKRRSLDTVETHPSIGGIPIQPEIAELDYSSARNLSKRQTPNIDNFILQPDFTNLEGLTLPETRAWFERAAVEVEPNSAGNLELIATQQGIASSKMIPMKSMTTPFLAGAGPSWGCTSVMVFSDLGIWMAHFWEGEQMREPGLVAAMNLMRLGVGTQFPSLVDANNLYFRQDNGISAESRAAFVSAVIFTVDYRNRPPPDDFPHPPRNGRPDTDPMYYPQVADITAELKRLVPALNNPPPGIPNLIAEATYLRVPQNTAQDNPGVAMLVLEYVPRHIHRRDDGQCQITRAFRFITPPLRVSRPFVVATLGDTNEPPNINPPARMRRALDGRAAPGQCPANIDALLAAQGQAGRSKDPEVFAPGGAGPGNGGGGGSGPPANPPAPAPTNPPVTTSSTPPPSPTTPAPPPTTPSPTGPPSCSNVQLPPGGAGEAKGWNCVGHPPGETVTWNIPRVLPETILGR
jgi:hypothetical protein